MNLRLRIVVGLVFFALLSAVATLCVFHRAMPVLEQPAYDRALESARTLDERINNTLFKFYTEAQQFAATPTALDAEHWANTVPTNALIAAMNADVKKDESYRITLYVDLNGNVRAVNTQSPKGKTITSEGYYGQNFATADWFTHARDGKFLEGKSGASGTAIAGPIRDANVAKAYGDDGYVLVFSTPVKDATGKTVGVWANFATFGAIENLLTEQYETFKAQGLSHTQLTLIDATGTLIADVNPSAGITVQPRDFGIIGKQNLVTEGYNPAVKGMSSKSGTIVAPVNEPGKTPVTQLVGFYHSDDIFNNPGIGWTVLARFDSQEIFASINNASNQVINGMALVMAVMFLLALAISGRITKRLRRAKATDDETLAEIARLKAIEETFPVTLVEKLTEQEKALQAKFESSIKPAATELGAAVTTLRGNAEKLHSNAGAHKEQSTKIAASATESARQLKLANLAAKKLASAMQELGQNLQKSAGAVNKVGTQAENLHNTVGAVTKESGQLQTAIGALTAIAKQINLLSMNATIEAARAGDSGKGLGLIAGEIKTLAGETATLADSLTQQVRATQASTGLLSGAVDSLQLTVTELGKATASTIEGVAQHHTTGNDVARQLEQLSEASTPLVADSAHVEKSVIETHNSAKKLLTAADALTDHAKKLGEKVETFTKAPENKADKA